MKTLTLLGLAPRSNMHPYPNPLPPNELIRR